MNWASSPTIGRREIWLCALGGTLLALAMSWPLVLHLGSTIAPDLGDPIRTAWQVAWLGHALLHQPLHIWQSNAFWPHADSLAFSDSLLGYAPAGLVGSGVKAAIVRYNLLWLGAYVFSFAGCYLLARELGLPRGGGAVAGAAFAYAPFRASEAGHLHVISSGGIALALFLLLRGYRRESWRTVLAGWAVAAWQLSLGFTLGLQFAYLLAVLAVICGLIWWRGARASMPRALLRATLAGIALFAVVGGVQARTYLKISNEYPHARRTIAQISYYSSPPKALLAAPAENRIWGVATAHIRNSLSARNEKTLFPGAIILILTAIGLSAPLYSRRLRLGLLAGAGVCAVLALGLGLTAGGWPYKLLVEVVPGFDGVRVPARIITLTSLALALLAGAGAQRLVWRVGGRTGGRIALVGAAVLVAAVTAEGAGRLAQPHVPTLPSPQVGLPGPILELPTDTANDRLYQLWSVAGWPSVANGNSTFDIPQQDDLRGGMQNFPDAGGVAKLQQLGIRTVILHTMSPRLPALHQAIPEPPDPLAAAARPITGLPLRERRAGSLVIYTIEGVR